MWTVVLDKEFAHKRRDGNCVNPFAVVVCGGNVVIGHLSFESPVHLKMDVQIHGD